MEVVGAEEYKAALCDPLAFAAPFMVQKWNAEPLDDIVRFCNYLTVSTLSLHCRLLEEKEEKTRQSLGSNR